MTESHTILRYGLDVRQGKRQVLVAVSTTIPIKAPLIWKQ
jgi:hypothetical protein